MANLKKSLRVELPEHTLTGLDRDAMADAFMASASEALDNYLSTLSLSEEDIQTITVGIERFLTQDPSGKTLRSCNMPLIAGKVAFVYADGVTNPDTFVEKVKAYIRNDRERFYVGKGRSADHAGGVVFLQRASEAERNKLIAKRAKAEQDEQEDDAS